MWETTPTPSRGTEPGEGEDMGLDPYLGMGRGIKEDVDTTLISRGDYETGRYSDLGDDTDIEVDGI